MGRLSMHNDDLSFLPQPLSDTLGALQSVYNEELFFLSHDDYVSPGLSVRIMNIHKFMNSKARRAGATPLLLAAPSAKAAA